MVILSNALLILNPLALRQAVLILDPSTQNLSWPYLATLGSITHSVWFWAYLLFVISLISAYFKYTMRVAFISISREEEKKIRQKIFARLQSQSMEFFNRHGVGELMSRLTNDISAYRDVLGPGVMYPTYFLTLVIPGIVALFYLSPTLTAFSLIPIILIPLLNFSMRTQIYRTSYASKQALGELSNRVQEDYSGMRIIKSYGVEKNFLNHFVKLCNKYFWLNIRLDILEGLFYPFLTLITRLVTLTIVLAFGLMTIYAWRKFSSADFVSFMWIQSYIFFPVLMLGWILPMYQKGRAAYDRLLAIYEESLTVDDIPSDLKIQKKAEISFRHLRFSYPGSDRMALKNINLVAKGGTFIGLTGPTGSGKSTLFKLLEREYEVQRGMIYIGDHDIRDYPLEAFRQEMISVEQLPFLFSKTIAENVRFGKQEASQEEIELVTKAADLHDTVLSFPEGYETLVGERGITLSGGQKQRVAMARAFLVNRSILLLDDIFSSVDASTEKKIFDILLHDFKGKTVLLITHRVSVLEKMERIIYLKEGEVVEDGTPKHLLTQNGYYAALVALQQFK